MNQARIIFASFPEVKQVVSQVGRPDDGTDVHGLLQHGIFCGPASQKNNGGLSLRKTKKH